MPACQSIVKKAIVKRLMHGHKVGTLPEDGALYKVRFALRKDVYKRQVLTVTTADAERAAREVLFFDGVPACTSAGATLAAAVQLLGMGKAKRPLCVFAGRHIYG